MSPMVLGLTCVGVIGVVLLFWLEYESFMRRTSVTPLPDGVRFKSYYFEVTVDYPTQLISLKAKQGNLQHLGEQGELLKQESGALQCSFAAIGYSVEVAGVTFQNEAQTKAENDPAAGLCQVSFTAVETPHLDAGGPVPASTRKQVQLALMPHQVGNDFLSFHSSIRRWVAKLEERRGAEIAERRVAATKAERKRLEDESKQEKLRKKAEVAQAQIEQWRKDAGFTGDQSALGSTPSGAVDWYIETSADGRAIIHSEGKTFIGSLAGGSASVIDDHVEVKVRDEFWDPISSPGLSRLAVLTGQDPEQLRQWRVRVEQLAAKAKSGVKPIKSDAAAKANS